MSRSFDFSQIKDWSLFNVLSQPIVIIAKNSCKVVYFNDAFMYSVYSDVIESNEKNQSRQDLCMNIHAIIDSIEGIEGGEGNKSFYKVGTIKKKNGDKINALFLVTVVKDHYILLIEDLKRVIEAKNHWTKDLLRQAENKIGLVKFCFANIGPIPEAWYNVDFLKNKDKLFYELGLHYITAISQSNKHPIGLFGPLPVVDTPYLALVYSYTYGLSEDKLDPSKFYDERFKTPDNCLLIPQMIILIFHKGLEFIFQERRMIRKIFETTVNKYIKSDRRDSYKTNMELLEEIYNLLVRNPDFHNLSRVPVERKIFAINEMAKDLTKFSSLQESCNYITEIAETMIDFRHISIWLFDRNINALRMISFKDYSSAITNMKNDLVKQKYGEEYYANYVIDFYRKQSIIARTAREKKVNYVPDVTKEKDYFEIDNLVRSELAVPIISKSNKLRLLGVINIEHESRNAFTDEDIVIIEYLSQIISHLIEREVVETKFLALSRFMENISINLDSFTLKSFFDKIADFVDQTFEFKIFATLLVTENGKELKMIKSKGYNDEKISDIRFKINSPVSVVAKAVRENRVLRIPDVRKVDYFYCADDKILSELAVPITIRGKAVGVLNVESYSLDAFTDTDERLMKILSAITGLILDFHFKLPITIEQTSSDDTS